MTYHIPNTELFIITLNNHAAICYSPLKDEICLIDAKSAEKFYTLPSDSYDMEMRDFIKEMDMSSHSGYKYQIPTIENTTKLSIIPNSICNLLCSYCYSASGRSNTKLTNKQIDTVLDWFADPKRVYGNFLSIFITGGGEPLTTWDVTSYIIARAKQLAAERGLRLHISVITNGTLITKDIIRFFKHYECSIGVSFDVIEDIQNANRGMYNRVKQNIKLLLAEGLRVMINTTIVPLSVGRMTEAVNEVIAEFPGISQFTMEPATGTSIYGSPAAMRSFYEEFLCEYFRAREIAHRNGLHLRFTFDDSLRGITTRHCPGKFALTPSGSISVCHLVSSPLEKRFDQCTYGIVTDKGVEIDLHKFRELYSHNLFSYRECDDCIAKWSCGGECFTRRNTYTPEFMAEVCRFNRNVVERLIREEVGNVEIP